MQVWQSSLGRVLTTVLLFAACGGDDGGADSTSFSQMQMDKIEYDCAQFVQCKAIQSDSQATPPSLDRCVTDKSAALDADVTSQWQFLGDYNRCSTTASCTYSECAAAHVLPYALSQISKITYRCQQELLCSGAAGDQVAQKQCETQAFLSTDNFTQDQQRAFEAKFNQCNGMPGCLFKECFVY